MIAATFFVEDEGELGMTIERKKDCTESEEENLNHSGHRGLEDGQQEEFPVPFGTKDRGFNYIGARAVEVQQSSFYLFDRRQLCGLVTHNASFTNKFPSRLELRFDEDDHLPAPALVRRLREGGVHYGRENQGRGNERHVDRD